ncbi:MAG: tRNA dihydrouridine synthase DusB [Eubacteriales bacterium]
MKPRVLLAPLAGVSDWPFRLLCGDLGADETVTEMISAQGYLCAPEDNRATQDLLLTHPGEPPVAAQVFGHDPKWFYEAIRKLTDSGLYSGIDINMGCPAPKVTNGGSGSALMKTPELAAKIIKAARQATQLPLSVKMRIGWDEKSINVLPFSKMAEEEGADYITVHGRTRAQHYSGKANWEAIARVKRERRIPVIANGDVFSWADAKALLELRGCDGVAIGRGALGNPWIFREIKQGLAGGDPLPADPLEIQELCLRHARLMAEWKGEDRAVIEMRKHFAWYLKGLRGAAQVRSRINTMDRLIDVENTIREYFQSLSDHD